MVISLNPFFVHKTNCVAQGKNKRQTIKLKKQITDKSKSIRSISQNNQISQEIFADVSKATENPNSITSF